MAASYFINTQAVTWAAGKNMLAISNHTGSGVIVDIYRIWMFSFQTATVSGGTTLIELWQCNSVASFTGGTAQTLVKHDTASATVPAQVLANAGTSTSLTKNSRIKRYTRVNEELAVSTATIQALTSNFPPINLIWDSGFSDSTIQPLRLRAGEGMVLFTPATGGGAVVGSTDICVELTCY